MATKTAVIIGAGPAGLTAAYELLTRTDVVPIVLEMSSDMGGISRTINHHGNRIDIGGHRFFSKSDRVMNWWLDMLPQEQTSGGTLRYQGQSLPLDAGPGIDPQQTDRVMLVRNRKSRIYYLRRFFDYPLSLSSTTVRKLGLWRVARIGMSYLRSVARPIRNERNLEEFFINRFGRVLYRTFFKSYTEKVWGVPCDHISAEWGAQRIKGLSIRKALAHALSRLRLSASDVRQKTTETSLIEKFLYPKFGPGQMWETAAERVKALGGQVLTHWRVDRVIVEGGRAVAVQAVNTVLGARRTFPADYVFSTMPVKHLVRSLSCEVPPRVREIADGLVYRDFITVGLLLDELKVKDERGHGLIRDNWIYIQEPDVRLGRLQIFNNWSPWMVADTSKVWLGLEYFCNEDDDLWSLADSDMIALGRAELDKIGLIDAAAVRDAVVIRVPKTYPAYWGTYARFDELRQWIDEIDNLFLVGRNGMHRYNNQDHSMLTAMVAVDNIAAGITDKRNIWSVNTEQDYHETQREATSRDTTLRRAG